MDMSLTTELAAVNIMLSCVGESPVNTLANTGSVDVSVARTRLAQAAREVQERGWHWNTEEALALQPEIATGEIKLPVNALKVDTVYPNHDLDLVQRGQRLYDRKGHTFAVGKPVTVDLVILLAFDEMPEAARLYVTARASRQFVATTTGSEAGVIFTREDEKAAWASLMRAEVESSDANMLRDSAAVYEVLAR
jgi:hypothetical protein